MLSVLIYQSCHSCVVCADIPVLSLLCCPYRHISYIRVVRADTPDLSLLCYPCRYTSTVTVVLSVPIHQSCLYCVIRAGTPVLSLLCYPCRYTSPVSLNAVSPVPTYKPSLRCPCRHTSHVQTVRADIPVTSNFVRANILVLSLPKCAHGETLRHDPWSAS